MRQPWFVVALGVLAAAQCSGSARILALLPAVVKSHLISYTSLTRGLAERGHEVTLVCAYPQEKNHPNQTVVAIGVHPSLEKLQGLMKTFFEGEKMNRLTFNLVKLFTLLRGDEFASLTIKQVMENPQVQAVLHKPVGYYDALILEPFFYQESLLALKHKLKVPVIAVHSHGDIVDINYLTGASIWPSFKPYPYADFVDNMDVLERLQNSLFTGGYLMIKWFLDYPTQQRLIDEYLPGSPPLSDLLYSADLTVFNSHHTLCFPAPTPPNVVFAGGMHIKSTSKPLPQKVRDFVDGAKDGLIYFSMGSLINTTYLSDFQRSTFIETFRTLKQRVLVKWSGELPENPPPNVLFQEWLPQGDILAHPNTRLFITHGGLLSTQETIYHGVPLIGVPTFADQQFNMQLALKKGYGLELNWFDLSQEKVQSAIEEILNNPKYLASVRKLSQLFRDQPTKPVDNALFWVEHVIKHGGAHLKPASLNLMWYEVVLLDLFLVCFTPVVIAVIFILCMCKRRQRPETHIIKKDKNL